MIVVSDTTAIINLAIIGELDLLPRLSSLWRIACLVKPIFT